MEKKELICIVCPLGCKLKIMKDDASQGGYVVEGNTCFRGVDYGIKEMTSPTRVLTSTVHISDASVKRLPVKTAGPIPKPFLKQAMEIVNQVEVKAPITVGQVIINNVLDTGVDIVASRSMFKCSEQEEAIKDFLIQG
jgi:CxxC motif-containing protein